MCRARFIGTAWDCDSIDLLLSTAAKRIHPAERQGIGRGLIEEGLKALRAIGAKGCILVGDPAFYGRFGFRHNPALVHEGVPPENLMYLPMSEQIPRGQVSFHPAFFVGA